jgi:hypothetical protein
METGSRGFIASRLSLGSRTVARKKCSEIVPFFRADLGLPPFRALHPYIDLENPRSWRLLGLRRNDESGTA